jgi:hypothetical protein
MPGRSYLWKSYENGHKGQKNRSLLSSLKKNRFSDVLLSKKTDEFIIILIVINHIMLYTKQADHRFSDNHTWFLDKPQMKRELKNGRFTYPSGDK